jgi:hypothetical protein
MLSSACGGFSARLASVARIAGVPVRERRSAAESITWSGPEAAEALPIPGAESIFSKSCGAISNRTVRSALRTRVCVGAAASRLRYLGCACRRRPIHDRRDLCDRTAAVQKLDDPPLPTDLRRAGRRTVDQSGPMCGERSGFSGVRHSSIFLDGGQNEHRTHSGFLQENVMFSCWLSAL